MKVIAIMNQKGGSGKTTLAFNIAHGLKIRGHRILAIDGDLSGGQYSLSNWAAQAEEPCIDVVTLQPKAVKQYLKTNSYDYVVIDTPPTADKTILPYLHAANAVLIPMGASPLDFWASQNFLEVVKNRQEELEGLPENSGYNYPEARIVMMAVMRNIRLIDQIKNEIEECQIPLMKNTITQFQVYPRCVIRGHSIFSYPETNKEAIKQINDLIDETLNEVLKNG